MNTDSLARHYDRLAPSERLALIIAAGARGDEVEQQRLISAAPPRSYQEGDYYPWARAYRATADLHMLTVLGLAAQFWQWWGLWMVQELVHDGKVDASSGCSKRGRAKAKEDELFRLHCLVRFHAYRLTVHIDAWKQSCSEWNIDPAVILERLPGWDIRARTEPEARELAFDQQGATSFLLWEELRDGGELPEVCPQPETVAGVTRAWQAIVGDLIRREGG